MKKVLALFTLIVLFNLNSFSQGCLPSGIILSSQKAIDSFPTYYPGCHTLEGSLTIDGEGIFNLDSLSVLTLVLGDVNIQKTTQLSSTHGLDNLDSIGGSLNITENQIVTDLSAFSSIRTIVGDLHISQNNQLAELTGLDSIKLIKGGLIISSNPELLGLDKLHMLKSVVGQISVLSNRSLKHLYGLEGITFHLGGIRIATNDSLIDFHGFDNLRIQRSSMFIENNPMALDFTGFGELQETYGLEIYKSPGSNLTGFNQLAIIGSGGLEIANNQSLESLEGMPQLRQIESSLALYNNNQLDSLKGFEQLENTFALTIEGNDSLVSLQGLNGLHSVETDINIRNNPMLKDLSALNGTYGLGRRLWISGNTILQNLHGLDNLCETAFFDLIIEDNPNLSVCNTACICAHLIQGGMSSISGNSTGCSTSNEIIASCMVATHNPESNYSIQLSPNPANEFLQISGLPQGTFQYSVFDILGHAIEHGSADQPILNIHTYSAGLYLLVINSDGHITSHSFAKF